MKDFFYHLWRIIADELANSIAIYEARKEAKRRRNEVRK